MSLRRVEFLFAVILLTACATEPVVKMAGSEHVKVGKADAPPDYTEVGAVQGSDGECMLGQSGNYDNAYQQLKNAGAAKGADYVSIVSVSQIAGASCAYGQPALTIYGTASRSPTAQADFERRRSEARAAGKCDATSLPEWQGADAVTKKKLLERCR